MSAEELRQAAETLRARAIDATPGPWESGERCIWGLTLSPNRTDEVVVDGPGGEGGVTSTEDADYIATMHPGVGLALADWLSHYAAVLDAQHPIAFADDAIAVARFING